VIKLFLLLSAISCNSTKTVSDSDILYLDFLDTWYEPVYNDCVYEYGIIVDDVLESVYGDYICANIKSNNTAYLYSQKYEKEGPFSWEYTKNSQQIEFENGNLNITIDKDGKLYANIESQFGDAKCEIILCTESLD